MMKKESNSNMNSYLNSKNKKLIDDRRYKRERERVKTYYLRY